MARTMLGCFIALVAIGVFAAGIGLKPGLWQTRIVKQVSDGKDMTAQITRASGVRCKAGLLDGSDIEFDAAGLLARALQHETDHLNGVLFIDRMNSAAKASIASKLKRLQKEKRGA